MKKIDIKINILVLDFDNIIYKNCKIIFIFSNKLSYLFL